MFVDLPPTEQVTRGQELLQMLMPYQTQPVLAPPGGLAAGGPCDNEFKMVVKRTFIELVAQPSTEARPRALSDSVLAVERASPLTRPSRPPFNPEALLALSEASTDEPPDLDEAFPQQWSGDADGRYWAHAQHPKAYAVPCMMSPAQLGELLPATCMGPFVPPGVWVPSGYAEAGGMVPYSPVHMDPTVQWQWAHGYQDFYSQSGSPHHDVQPRSLVEQSPSAASSSTPESDEAVARPEPEGLKTTVLLRNLPAHFTRAILLELLEDEGFEGTFDFLYLPIDFGAKTCLGYAFVNFVAGNDAQRCWQIFSGFSEWDSDKVCEVTWGEHGQGLLAHIERYRNSPVMHRSIPDEWKPLVFKDGQRVPFPAPTKSISAPKLRRRAGKDAGRTPSAAQVTEM